MSEYPCRYCGKSYASKSGHSIHLLRCIERARRLQLEDRDARRREREDLRRDHERSLRAVHLAYARQALVRQPDAQQAPAVQSVVQTVSVQVVQNVSVGQNTAATIRALSEQLAQYRCFIVPHIKALDWGADMNSVRKGLVAIGRKGLCSDDPVLADVSHMLSGDRPKMVKPVHGADLQILSTEYKNMLHNMQVAMLEAIVACVSDPVQQKEIRDAAADAATLFSM